MRYVPITCDYVVVIIIWMDNKNLKNEMKNKI